MFSSATARTLVRWFGSVAATIAVLSCRDSTGPLARGDLVIVGGGELNSLAVVSVSKGRVVARIGPMPSFKDSYGLSPDSGRLYVESAVPTPVTLTVIDTRSLQVVTQEEMSVIGARSVIGRVVLSGTRALAVSPDGRWLLLNGYRNGDEGVVLVDVATRVPSAFFGPYHVSVGGIVPLLGERSASLQRVLLFGTRLGTPSPSAPGALVLGGPALQLVDSLQAGVPLVLGLPVAGDGALYTMSASTMYRVDLASGQVVDSAPRVSHGAPCTADGGRRLYLTDPGDGFDSPGAGRVRVYDEALRALAPIDLSSGAFVPTLNWCALSRDGRYLFVSSGTPSVGPLFDHQPGRLFVVETASGSVVRTVDLGDWDSQQVFAF